MALSLIPKGHPNRGLFDVLAIASTVLALPLPAPLGANKEDAHSVHLVSVPLRILHSHVSVSLRTLHTSRRAQNMPVPT